MKGTWIRDGNRKSPNFPHYLFIERIILMGKKRQNGISNMLINEIHICTKVL